MVPDVGADVEAGGVVCRLQRLQHFKKVVQRLGLAWHDATRVLDARIFSQDFRDVISNNAVMDAEPFEHVADEHVKVKVSGDPQAAPLLDQRAEQQFVVQNQVARLLVGQQLDQGVRRAGPRAQHGHDEFNVLSGELNPAIGSNHVHTYVIAIFLYIAP